MDKSNPDANPDSGTGVLAQAYVPTQKQMGRLYDPYMALERGTKFEDLYNAGRRMWSGPEETSIPLDQSILYNQLCALLFNCVDLNLYLDTHPGDSQALMLYNSLGRELRTLKDEYEEAYGPVLNFGWSDAKLPFSWTANPWPWERSDY